MAKINPLLENLGRPSSIFPSRKEKIRLNWNELSPGYPQTVISRIMKAITPSIISSYPEYNKIYPLVAEHLGVNTDQIILESGSECGIKNAFEVFVPRGSSVVKPSPEFVMVSVYASIFGAKLCKVPYNKDLSFSVSNLLSEIDKDTALVYFANPNCPTNYYFSREDIIKILNKAKDADAVVFVDECYIDFSGIPSCLEMIKKYDNLIVSRSYSKAFGLAGLRLGVLATNTVFCELLHKTRPMREINAFAAEVGTFMLENIDIPKAMIENIIRSREWTIGKLTSYGYKVVPSVTNFILVDFGEDREKFLKKCEVSGILVKGNLENALLDKYVSISIGTKPLMENVFQLVFPLKK